QLSSFVGAGLFFSAGRLSNRVFPGKNAPPGSDVEATLQREQTARQQAEERARLLEQQHETAARQLAEERTQATELRTKLQNEGRTGEQLQSESRLREQAQQEVQRLTAQLGRSEAEVAQLRTAAGAARPAVDTKPLMDEN